MISIQLGLCFGHFGNNCHPSVGFVEIDDPIFQCKKGEVATHSNIDSRMVFGSALADNDVSGNHGLAAILLDAQHFWIAVPSVAGGSLSFLMCHG